MENLNSYTNTEILRHMDLNPELSVSDIAKDLGISSLSVGQAQHSKMIRVYSRYRNSVLWGTPGYKTDGRNWLDNRNFLEGMKRVEAGEKEVYEQLVKVYKISAEKADQLRAVN